MCGGRSPRRPVVLEAGRRRIAAEACLSCAVRSLCVSGWLKTLILNTNGARERACNTDCSSTG